MYLLTFWRHHEQPSNLKYTSTHEWIKTEADGTVSIGITQHAQELLGDMVFVEIRRLAASSRPRKNARSWNRSKPPPTCMRRFPAK